MIETLYSKDITSKILLDKIGEHYVTRQKIMWGADGVVTPVTQATPLPVTGSFSASSGFIFLGQSTPKVVPVTNVSTQLLDANLNRLYAHISNYSSSVLWLQYEADAVVGEGIRLLPNSIWIVSATELFLGVINGISTTSINVNVLEGTS